MVEKRLIYVPFGCGHFSPHVSRLRSLGLSGSDLSHSPLSPRFARFAVPLLFIFPATASGIATLPAPGCAPFAPGCAHFAESACLQQIDSVEFTVVSAAVHSVRAHFGLTGSNYSDSPEHFGQSRKSYLNLPKRFEMSGKSHLDLPERFGMSGKSHLNLPERLKTSGNSHLDLREHYGVQFARHFSYFHSPESKNHQKPKDHACH